MERRDGSPAAVGRTSEIATVLAGTREIAAFGLTRLSDGLDQLASLVEKHACEAESESGIIADIVSEAPRLDAATGILTRDHAELPAVLRRLGEQARRLIADSEEALDRLAAHQNLSADLLEDAYFTDIGGQS